jgi:nitrate/TMAO reductase-like tetraheme cytochrome c subunit
MSAKPSVKSAPKADVLTVLLTGNELGALKPCGCSGGQLGGLDRRAAIFNSVPASKRLIIDTGSFVKTAGEQDIIKFNIIIQAYNLLGYDLVNLTEEDIETGATLGLLNGIDSLFNVISSNTAVDVNLPRKFTKDFQLKEKTVAVTVAAFDVELSPIKQINELFAGRDNLQAVNILILNRCDAEIISSISKMAPGVDCLICPSESDEPMTISRPNQKPLVFSVGQLGKYVCKLQITSASESDKPVLSFSPVKVTEDLLPAKPLIELYKDYQQFVKDANLLEKYPRFTLPNGLKYEGSKSCKHCHEYEYEKWSGKKHAHAYATLEEVDSQFDPECVGCHVVGMEYESGFVSEEKSNEDLRNVGCESCHGPGSEHNRTSGKAKTTLPWSDCTDCHTPERSPDYAEQELNYFEKIIHWKEPNTTDSVK